MKFLSFANVLLFISASLLTSCASGKLYLNPSHTPQTFSDALPGHTIYAVGDAGALNEQSKAVMSGLEQVVKDDIHPGTIIFLGDNIYPAGFPPEDNLQGKQYAQDVLMNQVLSTSSYRGQIIFIPGNHDWNEFKPGGLEAVKRQAGFLHTLNDRRIRMLPENGCGGPVAVDLDDNTVMIIIDSQWWLHEWENEPEINKGCPVQTRDEFIKAFQQTLEAHQGKQIVISMHHPFYTQGAHGGHFTLRDHLFPLTKVVKWLYLPLPVIGSIYPYYRSLFGHPQDTRHRNYRALIHSILNVLDDEEEIIFLAGHDHNLQYIARKNDHFILSGSGSKLNPIANSDDLVYGHQAAGFMQLDFYKKEGVRLTAYEVDPRSGAIKVVFSRFIIENQVR